MCYETGLQTSLGCIDLNADNLGHLFTCLIEVEESRYSQNNKKWQI